MNFVIDRDALLVAMQNACSVVDRKPALDALANVLIRITKEVLTMTTSDTEVELSVRLHQGFAESAEFLVGARKLLDVCRSLPGKSEMEFQVSDNKVRVKSGRSEFKLVCYPEDSFALVAAGDPDMVFSANGRLLHNMFVKTQFSMANQDVRYYLKGMLLVLEKDSVSSVATDGHRLALSKESLSTGVDAERKIIIPKKGVGELIRILSSVGDDEVEFKVTPNHICLDTVKESFTSKLIDGEYPDYGRVIPEESKQPVVAVRSELHNCLSRVATLDPERRKGVEMKVAKDSMQLRCVNNEQEEAQVDLDVEYGGPELSTGFNVQYLLDVLSAIEAEKVVISLRDAESSCLIRGEEDSYSRFVVMPLHL